VSLTDHALDFIMASFTVLLPRAISAIYESLFFVKRSKTFLVSLTE